MNLLDIFFLILIAAFCIRGLFQGILKGIASIAGVFLGFWCANIYHADVTPYVRPYMSNQQTAETAAYILTVLVVALVVWLIIRGFAKLLQVAMLSWADRLLGGVFGAVIGLLICSLILLALTTFAPKAKFVQESRTAPYIGQATVFASEFVQDDVQAMFKSSMDKLKSLDFPDVPLPAINLPEPPDADTAPNPTPPADPTSEPESSSETGATTATVQG
jgi:membrane protein required for colicin V production